MDFNHFNGGGRCQMFFVVQTSWQRFAKQSTAKRSEAKQSNVSVLILFLYKIIRHWVSQSVQRSLLLCIDPLLLGVASNLVRPRLDPGSTLAGPVRLRLKAFPSLHS